MKEELLKSLTKEQIAKLKECKSQEDMLKIAKEEGVELTDEQLEAVTGGNCFGPDCPQCGSDKVVTNTVTHYFMGKEYGKTRFKECESCGYTWDEEEL